MNLDELLAPFTSDCLPAKTVKDLCNDSRQITEGSLFFAYPGIHQDGRDFITDALTRGAVAVVYEARGYIETGDLPDISLCVAVEDLGSKLALIAQRFYQNPEKDLYLTAVTGTNGKTTIAWLLAQAYQQLAVPSAYIGTLGQAVFETEAEDAFSDRAKTQNNLPEAVVKSLDNTTPDALCLQRLFSGYRAAGVKKIAMEVSSHALSQSRVDGLPFAQAIFTNLTHDHLDYHESFEAYAEAKAKLFAFESLEFAIVNQDDSASERMLQSIPSGCKVYRYGFHKKADIQALDMHIDQHGILSNIQTPWGNFSIQMGLIGQFNLYNALAVFTSLVLAGFSPEKVVSVLSKLKASPGRMEIVARTPLVIVDFAHSPDALQNVLNTVKQLKKGRMLLVFGCGGERDKEKRPLMGEVASKHADTLIVTSDNPRQEDPEAIIDAIISGIDDKTACQRIPDRKKAIETALQLAEPSDTILITGKGHETYQLIGDSKTKFSDQDFVREILKNR